MEGIAAFQQRNRRFGGLDRVGSDEDLPDPLMPELVRG